MKIKKFLPIIGIVIFAYIILKLDITNIVKEISQANYYFLLIAMVFIFIFLLTQTLKWFAIARVQKIKIPFVKAFKINLMSIFYGFITPARIGVAMRAEYLKKYNNGKLGKGLSNYTLDKILDLCSLVLIAIVSIILTRSLALEYAYSFLIFFILLVAGLIIFIEESRSKSILKIFYRFITKKLKRKAKDGFSSFYTDIPKKRYFLFFFFLNILNWIILETSTFFIGLSLGINIHYFYYLAILPLVTLISQIPITIGGLGTREASLIGFFGLLGIGATKVFSMSMISLFIAGIIPAIIGSFLIFKKSNI